MRSSSSGPGRTRRCSRCCLLDTKVRYHPSVLVLSLTTDVVPVLNATRGQWTHDPYGGEYEESTGFIWGRGSSDDKSGTIGAL